MQVLRQHLVLERQDDLDDAGDPRGCLQVADVRLRGADQQRPALVASLAEHRAGGLRLDRVSQRRPGAVRLQVPDVAGGNAGTLERLGDHPLLGNAVRHGQPAGCAVLVDRAAPDDSTNPIAVADRVIEPFDDDDAAALAAHVAVCRRVERLALAVRREHVRVRERDHGRRGQQHVGAAGQCQIAFPQTQRLACLVDGHQRRAAGRVDGDRRALQPQPVADPTGRGGIGRPDRHIGLDLGVGQLPGRHAQVVVSGQPDEHTGVGVRQCRWRGARMLDRLPRRLQQQPMLRVQQPGLAGRDAEERRVESRYVVDESRSARHHLPGCAGLRVKEFIGVPTILGYFRYRVPPLTQHLPESVGVRSARKARCVADDREARWRPLRMPHRCHRRCPPCLVPTGQPALPTASPNRSTTLLAVERFCKG